MDVRAAVPYPPSGGGMSRRLVGGLFRFDHGGGSCWCVSSTAHAASLPQRTLTEIRGIAVEQSSSLFGVVAGHIETHWNTWFVNTFPHMSGVGCLKPSETIFLIDMQPKSEGNHIQLCPYGLRRQHLHWHLGATAKLEFANACEASLNNKQQLNLRKINHRKKLEEKSQYSPFMSIHVHWDWLALEMVILTLALGSFWLGIPDHGRSSSHRCFLLCSPTILDLLKKGPAIWPGTETEFWVKVNKTWCKQNSKQNSKPIFLTVKGCDMMWLSLIHRSFICSFQTPVPHSKQSSTCYIYREKAMPARYSRRFSWIPKSVATWFLGQRTLSSGHHTQLPGHGKESLEHWRGSTDALWARS